MDIKVNNIEQTLQPEAIKAPQDTGSDAFKFALMSNIEETELQERLTNLMGEITAEGEIISKRKNIKDMRRYRALVKDFMNEILNRSHKFSRQNFLDKKGRHRVYGIIRLVDQKHIFDKFYQADSSREQEGNGLGLALVKRIVTVYGGEISVENRKERGCRFTVRLPAKDNSV